MKLTETQEKNLRKRLIRRLMTELKDPGSLPAWAILAEKILSKQNPGKADEDPELEEFNKSMANLPIRGTRG